MKSKTLHLLFAALWLSALSAIAGPRTLQQAKAIAEKHAAAVGMPVPQGGMAHKATRARKVAAPGTAQAQYDSYYVFDNGDGKGFTIVSGDDRMPEIVGYATQGSYDGEALPDGYAYFIEAYEDLAQQVAAGDEHALRTVREAEALHASGTAQVKVAPLLGGILWGQSTPYNLNAPTLYEYQGTEVKCATGCVATAMAQIMMYHRWPDVLKADIPAYVTKTRGYNIAGASAGYKIDWDNMLEQYAGRYTRKQAVAVANLMSLCGKAVKMDYNQESSAAYSAEGMKTYFGYDKETVQSIRRSWFTLDKWLSLLNDELAAARPVLMAGQSTAGGHAFVCDGADGNGLYHINWGWDGTQNGYFDLAILSPSRSGVIYGVAEDGFNRDCEMVIGLQKDNGTVDTPAAQWPAVSMAKWDNKQHFTFDTYRPLSSLPFKCEASMVFANISGHNLNNVKLAYGIKNANGGYTPVSGTGTFNIQGADGAIYGIVFAQTFNYVFPIGRTTIYGLYSTDMGKTWQCCQHSYSPVTVEATIHDLKVLPSALSATISTETDALYDSNVCTYTINVTNDGDTEYCNMLHAYVGTDAENQGDAVCDFYMTVPAHGTATRHISFATGQGRHYLVVKTDNSQGDEATIGSLQFDVKHQGTPQLTLVSVESNATPDAYETENAYANEYRVKVPRVDSDKLTLRYKVRNDGDDYYGTMAFAMYSGSTDDNPRFYNQSMSFGGNGTVSEFEKTFYASSFNSPFIRVVFNISGTDMTFSKANNWYPLLDDNMQGYGYDVPMNINWFYVTGTPAGISLPENGAQGNGDPIVAGGKGCIAITAFANNNITIYSPLGQAVATACLHSGTQTTIQLPQGLYVVCGKKVVVR